MERKTEMMFKLLDQAIQEQPFTSPETSHVEKKSRMERLIDKYTLDEPVAETKLTPSKEKSSGVGKYLCRPWNYNDFIDRVSTFDKPYNWFAKPDNLSPLQAARFGWGNSGYNKLFCGLCKAEFEHNSYLGKFILFSYCIFC